MWPPARYSCMDRVQELEAVAGLRAGDEAAFNVVYDAYRARLFSFLARLARDRALAEDLLEDTWLRLVMHAQRLEPDTHLKPWLYTVARNLYLSSCRARMLDDIGDQTLIGLWPAGAGGPSPFEAAAASELERRLENALARLRTADREVLMLIGVEGFTIAEAAAICEVSPVTLRQRLSRARARLARVLDQLSDVDVTVAKGALA